MLGATVIGMVLFVAASTGRAPDLASFIEPSIIVSSRPVESEAEKPELVDGESEEDAAGISTLISLPSMRGRKSRTSSIPRHTLFEIALRTGWTQSRRESPRAPKGPASLRRARSRERGSPSSAPARRVAAPEPPEPPGRRFSSLAGGAP